MPSRVLVVDCDRAASVVTTQLLSAAGYTPEAAHSFDQALRQIARRCPDLLITPVRLGQFNGLHLALHCRAQYPQLPIVVTADKDDASLAKEAQQYGVRFVERTTEPQLFLTLIGEILPKPELI